MRQNEREKEFHLCISLSLLQNIKISHFLSQNIEICHFLSRNIKIQNFLSRMSQKSQHTRYAEMILDQIRLRGSPASCASLNSYNDDICWAFPNCVPFYEFSAWLLQRLQIYTGHTCWIGIALLYTWSPQHRHSWNKVENCFLLSLLAP